MGSTPTWGGIRGEADLVRALDTSGKEGSVALARWLAGEGASGKGPGSMEMVARVDLSEQDEHASRLVPAIEEVLGQAQAGARDLTGLVVGAGPGSFTGVRVAAATAKGMAWSLGVPLWAVSSLAGAAAAVDEDLHLPRTVLFDARGDRVYAGAYRWVDGCLQTVVRPVATTVDQVLDPPFPLDGLLMGDGAWTHGALLEGSGRSVLPAPAGAPRAEGLLRVLAGDPAVRPVDDTGAWEPDYLRESGAERARRARRK